MKPIDEQKRQRVLQRANQAMADVEASVKSDETKKAFLEFMTKYASVEAGYKVLLQSYLQSAGRKVPPIESLRIQSRDIPRVLAYFDIKLDDSDRNNIFSGKQKKGERKARGLRNSLAHRPNSDALHELISKHEQLYKSMDTFRTSIMKEVQ
ncbi:MAG: hypothetical protein PUF86_03540 [Paratractidigestivibacter faecalis]|uniref:hypothetical protein n=1 Tax=Paratractidigestivibacter faecalis TaxID=2292441 RepID=UPI0026EB063A|nr:hypothetical protein [Paratractidigestivibacter faecalis]MDD6417739.1 hypothetical protein [Paratractidigestivibacter faecalis]